jgi:hypothetical protein
MIHVDAKNFDIIITSIAVSVASGTSLEVWTKEGSAVGFENDETAWTKIKGKMRKCLCLTMSSCDMKDRTSDLYFQNRNLQTMTSAGAVRLPSRWEASSYHPAKGGPSTSQWPMVDTFTMAPPMQATP